MALLKYGAMGCVHPLALALAIIVAGGAGKD